MRVRELTRYGWSLSSIATALSTHRSTVQVWLKHPDYLRLPLNLVPVVPYPFNLVTGLKITSPEFNFAPGEHLPRLFAGYGRAASLPSNLRKELERLTLSARTVRRGTNQLSQSREDSRKLNDLLLDCYTRGVPLNTLAHACARSTTRTIRNRLPDNLASLPHSRLTGRPDTHYIVVWPVDKSGDKSWHTVCDLSFGNTPIVFSWPLVEIDPGSPARKVGLSELGSQLGWHPFGLPFYPVPLSPRTTT
jgi:hypothetical protein